MPPPPGRIDFLGIGSQKAGTTWIFQQLRTHPQVRFPAGKETHYWDVSRAQGVPLARYLKRFPPAPPGVRQGEVTPRYATLRGETIAHMARVLPDVQLFATLRNPIARAWSAMEMVRTYAWMDPAEASDQFYFDLARANDFFRRGDFTYWLANWRSYFPERQLLLIDYELIASDPRTVMTDLSTHLGLDPEHFKTCPDEQLQERHDVPRALQKGEPRPAVVALLREQFAPLIGPMGEILGRDVSHWLEWDGRLT